MKTLNKLKTTEINNNSDFGIVLEWFVDTVGEYQVIYDKNNESSIILVYNKLKGYINSCIPTDREESKNKQEAVKIVEDIYFNFEYRKARGEDWFRSL